MFGWEFPPFKSGGLGTACYLLTKGLSAEGANITFVMPAVPQDANAPFVTLKGVTIKTVLSYLSAYATPEEYIQSSRPAVYGKNLFEEVKRYTKHAAKFAHDAHDIIHAHDWMTYHAAIAAKKISKKPLIMHLHATEFDRTGGNPNQYISHIEWEGLEAADVVITNSIYSKRNIIKHYNTDPSKIKVVHWGLEDHKQTVYNHAFKNEKTVLFLGRVTLQKGPDHFIEVAKQVSHFEPDARFIVVGSGDMLPCIINRAAELGLSNKVVFTGALDSENVSRAFQTASVYVMPSVSEPFGIVALESLSHGTPTIISKQSGVAEVLNHTLKVDFWDRNELTNKIVNVLRHPALRRDLSHYGKQESKHHTMQKTARAVKTIYDDILRQDLKTPKQTRVQKRGK